MNPVHAGIDAQFSALAEPMVLPVGDPVQCVVVSTGGSGDANGIDRTRLSADALTVHVRDVSRLSIDLNVSVRQRDWVVSDLVQVNASLYRVTLGRHD